MHLQDQNALVILAFFALGEGALDLPARLRMANALRRVRRGLREGNVAAAISFSGATLAAGIILGNAVEGEFLGWRDSIEDSLPCT